MIIRKRIASSGQGVALVLPWALAIAGVVFGLYAWMRTGSGPNLGIARGPDDPRDLKELRLAIATSRAENQALRQELDRMLGAPGARRPQASSSKPAAEQSPTESDPELEARQRDVSTRLQDALSRWSSGSTADKAAAGRIVWEALNLGDRTFATLHDAYFNVTDTQARMVLVGSMYFSRSPEVRDFLTEQVRQEKDPALRSVLIGQAAYYAIPGSGDSLESTFIESLRATDNPSLRKAAVRGLRYAQGDGVADALVNAASDPDEGVRLAAIDALSSRPELRQKLTEVVSRDGSPHVREVGNCRLLVAQEAQKWQLPQ